jgi:hypothetical protein
MYRVTPEGRAKAGDIVMTPEGTYVEVVSIVGAHEELARLSVKQGKYGSPNYLRGSVAGNCCLYGSTSGRERRNWEREKLKRAKAKALALQTTTQSA